MHYFPVNAALNKNGYENIDNIMNKGLTALSIEAFKKEIEDDAIILDTRNATEFTQGFIPNAISIGLEGRFAELTRVGFDQIIGYLAGSYQAWVDAGEKIDLIIDVEPDELKMDMNYDTRLVILDVRKELEFESGHVQTAVNIPLQTMNDVAVLSNIEDNDNVYIHCAGGYRSIQISTRNAFGSSQGSFELK